MVSFVNSFLSYLMLMLVIIVVAGCGFAIGLFLRKRKDANSVSEMQEKTE